MDCQGSTQPLVKQKPQRTERLHKERFWLEIPLANQRKGADDRTRRREERAAITIETKSEQAGKKTPAGREGIRVVRTSWSRERGRERGGEGASTSRRFGIREATPRGGILEPATGTGARGDTSWRMWLRGASRFVRWTATLPACCGLSGPPWVSAMLVWWAVFV